MGKNQVLGKVAGAQIGNFYPFPSGLKDPLFLNGRNGFEARIQRGPLGLIKGCKGGIQ